MLKSLATSRCVVSANREPRAEPAGAPYQWVLNGPFFQSECAACRTPDCRRMGGRCHPIRCTPFYVYVWTQVEGERGATISDETVPVPNHEAPFVGNPGPGSVRDGQVTKAWSIGLG